MNSEEKKSPDELTPQAWEAYRRAFSLPDAIQDIATSATKVVGWYGGMLKVAEAERLEEISRGAIPDVPEDEGWKVLAGYDGEVRDILLRVLETLRAGNRRTVIMAAIGWLIAIISIAAHVIT